jgi:AcrR family transcriptional regulator
VPKFTAPSPESRVTSHESAARAGTLVPAASAKPKPLTFPEGTPRLEQIRRVGCRLLYQYGYGGMTMRQFAGALNIKAASLYHHFPSKQHFLFDLMHETATELLKGLQRIVKSEPRASASGGSASPLATEEHSQPLEQLDEAIRWHVLFHTERREEAFVSHSEMRSLTPENLETILRVRRDYEKLFGDLLIRCQKDGLMPRKDTRVVRNAILTMCTATAGWFNPAGRLTAGQVADEMVAFIHHGLLRSQSL